MNKNNSFAKFLGLLSGLSSIAFGGLFAYLSILRFFLFIPLAVYFVIEGLFYLTVFQKADENKVFKKLGIFQIVSTILVMVYLLVFILFNNPANFPSFIVYLGIGIFLFIKTLCFILNAILMKKDYNPIHHGLRNFDIIDLLYGLTILELIIFALLGFEERPLYILIIELATNAIFTFVVAAFALSSAIRANAKEDLTVKGKIQHFSHWFSSNEVTMYFSGIFTLVLSVFAFINIRQNFFYIFLAIFYLVMLFLRVTSYIWHKKIVKKYEGDEDKINRHSGSILIFNAIVLFINVNAFAVGALLLFFERLGKPTNILLFLFFLLPMVIMRIVTANNSLKNAKKNRNTYHRGLAYISIVNVVISAVSLMAVLLYYLPYLLKIVMGLIVLIAMQLFLFIMVIIIFVQGVKARSGVTIRRYQTLKKGNKYINKR